MRDQYPSPVSDPEAEGLPDTADDDSTAYDDVHTGRQADGPAPAALPADRPVAVDRFGTTAQEQLRGESLEDRLAQEQPDFGADVQETAAGPPTGRAAALADPSPSAAGPADDDRLDDSLDESASARAALDADVLTDGPQHDPDSQVSYYDRPDPLAETGGSVGRLVAPDQGAAPDREKDEVAHDMGAAGGGATAEELAMHEAPPPQ
ncbi:MAG TPA: DUF5709 domain-containing protein [Pilimelia sp.]|nr:DUF5709 domain-containing protein [Pilimelia sp.]